MTTPEAPPHDGQSAGAGRITAAHGNAALACHNHPVDPDGFVDDAGEQAQPRQARDRTGIECVAAQLVARKLRAIDHQHPRAAAREDGRGNGARGAGADDYDIEHAKLTPNFTTPQLHNESPTPNSQNLQVKKRTAQNSQGKKRTPKNRHEDFSA